MSSISKTIVTTEMTSDVKVMDSWEVFAILEFHVAVQSTEKNAETAGCRAEVGCIAFAQELNFYNENDLRFAIPEDKVPGFAQPVAL